MKPTTIPTATVPAATLPIATRLLVFALFLPFLTACQPEKGKDDDQVAEGAPAPPAAATAPSDSPGDKPDELVLKRLLSTAAAMDREQFEQLTTSGQADPGALAADGVTLTEHFVIGTTRLREDGQEFFLRFNGPADPTKLAIKPDTHVFRKLPDR